MSIERTPLRKLTGILLALALAATAAPALAVVQKAPTSLDAKTLFHPGFHETPGGVNLADSPELLELRSDWRSFLSAHPEERVLLDPVTGRIHAVSGAIPWIPGLGNSLTMSDISRWMTGPFASPGIPELESIARDFVTQNPTLFLVPKSMAYKLSPNASIASSPSTWSLWFDLTWNDVPIEGAALIFVVKHGNLVLWGTKGLDDIALPETPAVTTVQARDIVEKYVGGFLAGVDSFPAEPRRIVLPERSGSLHGYRDVWEIRFVREGEGSYVGRIDTQSGALLEFFDENDYAQVKGGIYPKTNTAGTEVVKPLGFADYGTGLYSDSGATFTYAGGTVTSKLAGKYVTISDACGAISLSTSVAPGDLNFGTSTGTDCTTPGTGGAGNTHASRSCYYHVDLIKQKGRVFYPSNSWLNANITCNVNINLTCNAFWNGSTLNFYRKNTSACGNTGEIAAIFLHEWGHGMDSNDGNGAGGSGEAMGDTVAMLQIRDSCIGQNFTTSNCGGYGNACTSCTGVRDQDRAKHATNEILTPGNIATRCTSTGGDPCGREVHCEGELPANTVWDLAFRDLPARPMATEDAWALIDKLWWESGATRNAAYTCTDKTAPYLNNGCGASSWFMTFMAADDDDGNLANGTPHAATIFGAFDRHGISCGLVGDASNQDHTICPTIGGVGTITATAGNNSVTIGWSQATNAAAYRILRNSTGCGTGMTEIARPADNGQPSQSYIDTSASNGNTWSYQVQPIGSNADCVGSISNCVSATPAPAPEARYLAGSATQTVDTGDNDGFPDNCETVTVQFTIANTGSGALTNVRVTALSSSFAGVAVTTSLPITVGSIAAAGTANGSFQYTLGAGATKATCGQNIPFSITVAANEMAGTTSGSFSFTAEQDIATVASRTYSFETDFEGWAVVQGTFTRTTTYGASAGTWALASSVSLDNQCDQVRSPMIRPTASSTLAVGTHYDIEPATTGTYYDRANVAATSVSTGLRSLLSPTTGRTYNATTGTGPCVTGGQNGWAASATTWADSSGFPIATYAGQWVQLDVGYGTDTSVHGTGFRIDNIRLTNFQEIVCDAQPDTCNNCTAPGAPTLTAATPTCAGVDLSWTAGTGTTLSYNVYRSTNTSCPVGTLTKLNASPIATLAYSDTTAVAGTTYTYVVRGSCDATGTPESANSNCLAAARLVSPTPTITGAAANVCPSTTVTLTTEIGKSSYQWYLGGTPIGGANASSYNASATGNYTVSYTDTNGCSGTSATKAVTISPCVPNIVYQGHGAFTPVSTNGDSVMEAGEKWSVQVTLQNTGNVSAASVQASLSGMALGDGITVCNNPGTFGTIAAGGTASYTFIFIVDPAKWYGSYACGNALTFNVVSKSTTTSGCSCANELAAFSNPVGAAAQNQTATQVTTPLNAANSAASSNLTPAFTIASPATTATLSYSSSYNSSGAPVALFGPDDLTTLGNWTASGYSANAATGTCGTHSSAATRTSNTAGTYTLTLTTPVSTVGYTSVTVGMDWRVTANTATEYLDWSTDGTSWTLGAASINTTTLLCDQSVALPAGAAGQATLYIRFRTVVTSNARGIVDYISINATPPAGGSWTANARVSLVDPSNVVTVLKAYGAADANPYDVASLYTGPGTYQVRLEENFGGTATLTAGSMAVTKAASCATWAASCSAANPKEASPTGTPMSSVKATGTTVSVAYTPGCAAADHSIYWGTGPIAGALAWTGSACGLGTSGTATFDPGSPASDLVYFVVVAYNATVEGSYGLDSSLVEEPEAVGVGACDRTQNLTGSCP